MDNFDRIIKENIQDAFRDVAPDDNMASRLCAKVEDSYKTETKKLQWKKYYKIAIAAVFMIIIGINGKTIMAFVNNVYQQFFGTLKEQYEDDTLGFEKDLDKTIVIGDSKIKLSQYVVTEQGVDFKLTDDKESRVELVGCEVELDNNEVLRQEMIAKTEGTYIVSEVFEKGSWSTDGNVEATIEFLYTKDNDTSEVYTSTIKVDLDTKDKYPCRKFTNFDTKETEEFELKEITINPWYMKTSYRILSGITEEPVLYITQDNKELLYLSGNRYENEVDNYFEKPKDLKDKLDIRLGELSQSEEGYEIKKKGNSCQVWLGNE